MDILLKNELDDDDDQEDLMEMVCIYLLKRRRNKKMNRRYWVHQINQQRSILGQFHVLFKDLLKDDERFHMYFRVNEVQFEQIHEYIKDEIHKKCTKFREAIHTRERLAISLR